MVWCDRKHEAGKRLLSAKIQARSKDRYIMDACTVIDSKMVRYLLIRGQPRRWGICHESSSCSAFYLVVHPIAHAT